MSTVDTSTWSPDTDLNESIEGIPLNADSAISQTWLSIRALMAALKGDGDAIRAFLVPFSGATASADGASGLVPAPEAGDQDKFLKGDRTWSALSASDIPNIDASAITSGTIDIARLPAGALERLVTVADQTARYALTTASVQLGDTVKQLDTGVMYIVVDTSKLGQAAGYVEYTAGSAASVPWSGVTGKPSTFTPSSHTHGSITNDGKLGTASRVVVTDGSKAVSVSSVTSTELGYLSGVTSAVQTQISGKADDSGVVHKTGDETVAGTKTFGSQIVGTIGKSVGNGAFADIIQTYQSDNNSNRSCTIRCTNGDGYNTIQIGAHNESNGAPSGLSITNTDGVLTGDFAGSLRLTRTTDAQGTEDNKPALSIGATSGTHLELDGNEIMAKSSGTTTGTLYINGNGGDVYIGGNTTNHKAVTGRGKGSSTVPVYTDANGIVTACGNSLDVDVSGNAATATAFSTSKDVTLTGAVTGTASSTGGWSVSTLWRSCIVGLGASSTSNPWYKVATCSFASNLANYDVIITFLVENTYYRDYFGILRAHVRIGSDKTVTVESTSLKWLVNNGLPIEDFVLVCPTAASPTVEIWTRISSGWTYRRFVVLSEGTRNEVSTRWTLLNASSSTGQEASITTEGTQITSVAPDLVGNIATATEFSANKAVTLTGDVTGSTSSKAGWSIATTVGAITDAQIAALFENDSIDPDDPPMAYPERAVLCGDGVWRYFEQIAFPI